MEGKLAIAASDLKKAEQELKEVDRVLKDLKE